MELTASISDIGEQGLLARLQSFCPAEIIGDDGAILAIEADKSLVVTTDVLVDGVHFSDRTTSPIDAGWRAAAANLSDLAAMGATPIGITAALSLPGTTAVSWVEQLYQGLTSCLQQYSTPIVGGDITRSPVATIAITAFGQVESDRIIKRSAAKPGDAILATGVHGASRAGLEILLHPEIGAKLTQSDRAALIQAHQRPQPRLDVLPLLWDAIGDRSKIPPAGMDSSDGLADAIIQICRCSGAGATIDRRYLPLPPALPLITTPEQATKWVLYGGEDFELVLCLPIEIAQPLAKRLGSGATIVGKITAEKHIWLIDSSGLYPPEELTLSQGFQHF